MSCTVFASPNGYERHDPVSAGKRPLRSSRRSAGTFVLQEIGKGLGAVIERSGRALPSATKDGAQGRNRTTDTVIFSHVLYQLSYLGMPAARGSSAYRSA